MSCIEGFRRRFTLSDQMSILDTSMNLRDLLRLRDDDLHDEESGTSYRGLNLEDNSSNSNSNSKQQKSWKSFKDRLLLRKAAAAGSTSSSSNPIVVSDDDCGMVGEYSSSPNIVISGIRRRSSFSVVSPTKTSISPTVTNHVQNDVNQQGSTISTLASSSSEPVVITRLAAALAAKREEQGQQLVSSSSSTDAQLPENSEGITIPTSTVLQVTEDQQGRPSNQTQTQIQNQTQNQTQTPIQNVNQRGVVVASNDNQPLRVSLMALLEETVDYNRQDLMDIEEEEGDDQDQVVVVDKVLSNKEKGGSGGGMTIEEYKCCVCMIRPKGAAFIPCGHTFCRLCSRKLWVNRGNCPLCNNFILEILDIF